MGLFQNLLETYEKCKDAAGIQKVVDGEHDEKKTFLPLFHTTFKSQICIILNGDGTFANATRDNKDITIIIPCTDKSAGRASGIAAHPLCDQLDYVGGINEKKTSDYLEGLDAWEKQATGTAKVKLKAIYTYVNAGRMILDLEDKQLFKDSEYDTQGDAQSLNHEKIRKIGVRFVVEIRDDLMSNVWEDKDLRQSWIDYIKPRSDNQKEGLFDYLCGVQVGKIASQHPKNINSMTGNAKLLSCNDMSGYTFRGRFLNQDEAVIVDYEQSQKMHQTLRWLINNYGYNTDSQTIIVWAVDADTAPPAEPYNDSYHTLWPMLKSEKTEAAKLSDAETEVDANYSKKLSKFFQGYGKVDNIEKHAKKICIAAFDAATTGRMGLTFYQELPQDTYLENIVKWHNETSYYLTAWIKEDEKGKDKFIPKNYIGAPSFDDIIFAVYGKARGGNDAGYNTLKRKVRKQLLECMFGNFPFPKNMVDMAAVRASQPMAFTDSNGKFSPGDWNRSVGITCALARKFYKQQKEEEITLVLDETRKDRDYLFGRLLAVADRLEQAALYKADKKDIRATNAIRLMGAFSVKPYHTWGILYQQLLPYINQLKGAGYYQSIIDDIMVLLAEEYENNKPLSPLYLLGFSAQRKVFNNKNKQENTEVDENDITEQN